MKLPDSIEKRLSAICEVKLLDYVEEVIDEKELEQIVKEQIRKYSHNIVKQVLDSPDTKGRLCQKIYPALERELGVTLQDRPVASELNVKYILEQYVNENPDTRLRGDINNLVFKLLVDM